LWKQSKYPKEGFARKVINLRTKVIILRIKVLTLITLLAFRFFMLHICVEEKSGKIQLLIYKDYV